MKAKENRVADELLSIRYTLKEPKNAKLQPRSLTAGRKKVTVVVTLKL